MFLILVGAMKVQQMNQTDRDAPPHFFKICSVVILLSLIFKLFFMANNDLLVEEAYYWNYAQHLDWGYLDHPPMVALLIHWFTHFFGTSELSVRLPSLFCWLVTAVYSFRLSHLIVRGSGIYALMFLSTLPFFFLQSMFMTPDMPLMACWSALLYALYRVLVFGEGRYWFAVGLILGFGLLSKYTIALLGLPTFAYICFMPDSRFWLRRKEPYIAILIALLVFSPVIYWNMVHDWASFVFQSQRRIKEQTHFSLHEMLGILLMFLTPIGLAAFTTLLSKNQPHQFQINLKSYRFIQIFTLLPLAFFAIFSLSHPVKFNWIGPSLLAIIPWFSWLVVYVSSGKVKNFIRLNYIKSHWILNALALLAVYLCMMVMVTYGVPKWGYNKLFTKFTSWSDLTSDLHSVAHDIESKTQDTPIFVPLDTYNIASELSFYQHKLALVKPEYKPYLVVGAHIFGTESLMYKYWYDGSALSGRTLILISSDINDFENTLLSKFLINRSEIQRIWAHSQGAKVSVRPYYYQTASMN